MVRRRERSQDIVFRAAKVTLLSLSHIPASSNMRGTAALITASWHAGQPEMARKDAERLLHAFPDFRMSDLRRWPFQDPEHWDRFVRGLTEAGLPM